MQKVWNFYERLFSQLFLYFYRHRKRFTDWGIVVIYPSRSTEQDDTHPFYTLLESEQVVRIYLDELGSPAELPLWVGMMVLTTVNDSEIVPQSKELIQRAESVMDETERRAIIEMVATVVSYRFTDLNLQEIQAMLDMPIKESLLYREGQIDIIRRQLSKRLGEMSTELKSTIQSLTASQLEELGEAVLDFESIESLEAWLKKAQQ